ncbi:DNA polymerase I [uncultured Thomasclavelia sp.]|uniref:DNA polymerase I n=1 Tax=uncultured Thomasclavelia sp. TaxID=3025759 RepID=UPI002600A2D4|nr:DNA polymerase I [uncultured Thomasclavelia sp.]
MKELVLIDGNSLLYRAYYATAAMGNLMTNKDGIPTNAVFGFANMLESVLKGNPEYLVVAFDYGKKTFRNDLFEVYKGTRSATPDELVCQFSMIREYLTAHGIKYQEVEGYEGDDVIGTIATQASKKRFKVSIVTSDKDMLQLVTDEISVYLTKKGVGELEKITPAKFKEMYGLIPDQMRDLKGLMGDKSDNIPGIPGVGEKTALKLLKQYHTVENLNDHLDELKGKMGEKIRTNIDQGLLSKKIATIIKDVPIDVDVEDYRYTGYEYNELAEFYRRYGMNSLLKRMSLSKEEAEPVKEVKVEIVSKLPVIKRDSALVAGVFDSNYHRSIIIGFAIYNDSEAYYIGLEDALNCANFKQFIASDKIEKYGYDIKKAINASRWHGLMIENYVFDLQLASYILNPSLKDEIRSVCEYYDYYDVYYDEEVYGKGAKKKVPETSKVADHLIKQAKAIYVLKDQAIEKLKHENQYELYKDVEMPVAKILADMEYQGAKIDLNVLKELQAEFGNQIAVLEQEIHQLAGKDFNIASPKQLGEVLFVDLGLPNGKKTKTGYSTSVEILNKIKGFHPIVEKVLKYRTLSKLYSTYIVGLQDQIFVDGKIHTIYNQALTQTGRLSSTDPNLQNIPVKTPEGKLIRKAFIPENDYLVSFDYSQIELRVLAHLANVKSLIKAFNEDKDIHRHTASEVFNVPEDQVDSTMRRNAKAVNFGIIYGMSDFGLAEQIGVSVSKAREFINSYFENYPEIKTYMDNNIEFCKKNGYVTTMLNRKRFIKEINEKNYMRQELGKRLAMNTPIQGSAADIIKVAMIKVDQLLKKHQLKSKMILQVHDELIFDVYQDELDEVMELVEKGMSSAIKMNVELKAEGSYAVNWYELK